MKKFFIATALITIGFYGGYLLSSQQSEKNEIVSGAALKPKSILNLDLQTKKQHKKTINETLNFDGIARQESVFAQLHYAYELANQSNISQLESYLDKSMNSRDPLYNYNIVTIFFEAYTALNPLSAISFVEKNPEFLPEHFISHIVTSWVRYDPEGAIDYFLNIKNRRVILTLGARLLQEPSLINAGLLTEIAAKMGPNPDKIIENARLKALDPEDAFIEAQYLRGMARIKQMQTSIYRWMGTNPEAALNQINNMENKQERTQMLQLAYSHFASRDVLSALAHFREHHGGNENLEQNILTNYTQQDVKGALPLIEAFVQRTGKTQAMSSLLARWVQIDPVASLAYADTLDDKQKLEIYQNISRSYQQIDPEAGLAWALGLDSKYQQVGIRAAMQIQAHNVEAAEALVDSLTDKAIRETLFSSIARTKGQSDPEGALLWLEKYEDDPAYNSALQNILMSWSMTDPKAAANSLDNLSSTELTQPIIGQIAQNWYRTKPDEATEWVSSMPAGEGKYIAITNIALMIGRTDPEAALKLIEDLPTQRQEHARINLAYTMIGTNPSGVEGIIQNLKLDEKGAKNVRLAAQSQLGY